MLEWVVISLSRGSSRTKNWTWVSCISCFDRQILYLGGIWATWEAPHLNTTAQTLNGFPFHWEEKSDPSQWITGPWHCCPAPLLSPHPANSATWPPCSSSAWNVLLQVPVRLTSPWPFIFATGTLSGAPSQPLCLTGTPAFPRPSSSSLFLAIFLHSTYHCGAVYTFTRHSWVLCHSHGNTGGCSFVWALCQGTAWHTVGLSEDVTGELRGAAWLSEKYVPHGLGFGDCSLKSAQLHFVFTEFTFFERWGSQFLTFRKGPMGILAITPEAIPPSSSPNFLETMETVTDFIFLGSKITACGNPL